MRKKAKLLILVSVALIITIGVSGCSNKKDEIDKEIKEPSIEDENITVTKFPEFKLKDLDDNNVSSDLFDDYKMTIVPIWQSTCGPCIGELDALNIIYEKFGDQGVNVLGISVDDVETMGDEGVKRVSETLELDYENVIADRDYMMKLVNYVEGTPTTYIIGKEGEILMGPKPGSRGKEKDIEDFTNIINDILDKE